MAKGDTPLAGATVDQMVNAGGSGGTPTSTSAFAHRMMAGYAASPSPPNSSAGSSIGGWGMAPAPAGQDAAQDSAKAEAVLDACHSWWDSASDDARKSAVDELNDKLHLDPPLSQNASWKEVTATMSSGIVEKGGSYLGASLGGPAGDYLGALAGKCLGGKGSDFDNNNYDGVVAWCKNALDSAGTWIKDQASSIYDDTLGQVF